MYNSKYNFLIFRCVVIVEKEFYTREGVSYSRCIEYPPEVFLKSEMYFGELEALLKSEDQEKQFVLQDKFMLLVSLFRGNIYVGIKEVDEDGEILQKSGVNFDDVEWNVIMSHWEDLKALIKRKSPLKRKINGKNKSGVYMYNWKWMCGDNIVKEGVKPVYFENEAMNEGMQKEGEVKALQNFKELSGELKLITEMILVEAPESTMHMKLLYFYMIEQKILELTKEDCDACKSDSGSQVAHYSLGNCLQDDESVSIRIEKYFKKARELINSGDMCEVFYTGRNMIGAKPIFAQQLARCAINYIPSGEIIMALVVSEYNEDSAIYDLVVKSFQKFQKVQKERENIVSM